MLELRSGKDLQYSNRIPGWAKTVHVLLLVFVGLLGTGGFLLGLSVGWPIFPG